MASKSFLTHQGKHTNPVHSGIRHADIGERYSQTPQSLEGSLWPISLPEQVLFRGLEEYPTFCSLRITLSLTRHGILSIPICPGLYTGLSVWIKVFLSACLIRTFCFFWNSELASETVITTKATSSRFPTGGGTCRYSYNHHSEWIPFTDPKGFGITIMI